MNTERKQYTINGRTYDIQALVTTGTGLYVHEHNSGVYYCLSYDTVVAVYDNTTRKLYRTWFDYSRTTAQHINRFARLINSECSDNVSYFDWKIASDYTADYRFDTYAIRARISYTPPKMWCGYNEGRYYW